MKKTFRLMMMTALAAVTFACASPERKGAETIIGKLEAQCPADVAGIGRLTDVTVEADNAVFTFDCDNAPFDIDEIRANPAAGKELVAATLAHSAYKPVLKAIVKAGMGVKAVFKDDDESADVTIAPEDLKVLNENASTDHQLDEDMLTTILKLEKAELPESFADDVDMVALTDDGDFIVYECAFTGPKADVAKLKANKVNVEENMYVQLNKPEMLTKKALQRKMRKGMRYNFKDAAGDSLQIEYVFGAWEKQYAPAKGKTPENRLDVDLD